MMILKHAQKIVRVCVNVSLLQLVQGAKESHYF